MSFLSLKKLFLLVIRSDPRALCVAEPCAGTKVILLRKACTTLNILVLSLWTVTTPEILHLHTLLCLLTPGIHSGGGVRALL